jgi:undecaprenyl-diphosphatase
MSVLFSVAAMCGMQASLARYRWWLEPVCVVSRMAFADEGMFLIVPPLVWLFPANSIFILLCLAWQELLNGVLKWSLQRPRPFWVAGGPESIGGFPERDFSCPSSHSQTVACLVSALWWRFDTLRDSTVAPVLMALLVIWIGWIRVYMGVHFPGDVLLGWLVGCLTVAAVGHSGVVSWFEGLEDPAQQVQFGVGFSVIAWVILVLVRLIVPSAAPEMLDLWARQGAKKIPARNGAPLELKPRRMSTYFFQLAVIPGGCVGYALSAQALRRQELSFLEETCTTETMFPALVRIGVGMFGLVFCFLPAFLVHKLLGKPVSDAAELVAFAVTGFWLLHGAPAAAEAYFGAHC